MTVTVTDAAGNTASKTFDWRVHPAPITSLSTGYGHTCVIDWWGDGWCWGKGSDGQLGDGGAIDQAAPVQVNNPYRWDHGLAAFEWPHIATGAHHSCAADATNRYVICWGKNTYGQLGSGGDDTLLPEMVQPPRSFRMLVAGENHTCGLFESNGFLACWGRNNRGQVGDGTNDDLKEIPHFSRIAGLTQWKHVTAGREHSCAVTKQHEAFCWGANEAGQLGVGDTEDRNRPQPVAPDLDWAELSAGDSHTCGITMGGDLYCWGEGGDGQLGTGVYEDTTEPVQVGQFATWAHVSAGKHHTCAVTTNGDAYCWGDAAYGRLGNGRSVGSFPAPQLVAGGMKFSHIAAAVDHTCGVVDTSYVYCWGRGESGRLGNGDAPDRAIPQRVLLGN